MKELFEQSEKKSRLLEEQLKTTKADDKKTIDRLYSHWSFKDV